MDRWLGRPLPHQLSNPTRAHPCAINLWYSEHAFHIRYAVLASVSGRYPPHKGRLLTRYSPVRHWSEDRSPLHRSTWMCYARRQRSSWARIKLSKICIISLAEPLLQALQSFSSFCSSFYFLLEFIFSFELSRFYFALFSLLCTYLFVVQFSMTGLPPIAFLPSGFLRRLEYYIISSRLCQAFFESFFRFFWLFSDLFLS